MSTKLQYIGQAGFIIENSSGKKLAVDLYLSDCVERLEGHIGYKRLLPKIYSAKELEIDYLIATHAHYDHYDYDSIPLIMEHSGTTLFATVNCGVMIEEQRIPRDRVVFVRPGDYFEGGGFKISFGYCDHGNAAPDAVSVLVEVDHKRVLMTGDTCFREDKMSQFVENGECDVVIGPINGAYGNMNEKEFVDFIRILRPKMAIPCHFGMFASHGGNPGKFLELMKCNNGTKPFLMTQGEILVL